eukprot:CAMPEP_0201577768 /NCGR_PEP_ID=MMETSP0190_2-20130828/24279_1 /ASSEMBLY_ACC=CAM_ASM_000263 /TAXON_ID=37353 /ORGANISM="Rosalina sp." /LENGTH=75 /DNA_ID=CAMNT_0048010133 /DNA_START=177 /DNA_END=404 /DNA_ORIENTATION=-
MGIRWSIVEGKTLCVDTQSGQTVRSISYCHIGISCVATNNGNNVGAVIVVGGGNNQNYGSGQQGGMATMEVAEGV